jgi:uncharacterized protein (DUF488 family)
MSKSKIKLYTIGFTQKTAENFFNLLRKNAVDVLMDTRLKPDSQLSGFAKSRDLPYFLKNLIACDYQHNSLMSPTDELLSRYRHDKQWSAYETAFNQLLQSRNLIGQLDRAWWESHAVCLLCSEHEPDHCHRRLVAEYIASHWLDIEIKHLI